MEKCIQLKYTILSEDRMSETEHVLLIPFSDEVMETIFPNDGSYKSAALVDQLIEIAYNPSDPNYTAVNELLNSNSKFKNARVVVESKMDLTSGYPKYSREARTEFIQSNRYFMKTDLSTSEYTPKNYTPLTLGQISDSISSIPLQGFRAHARSQVALIQKAIDRLRANESGVMIILSRDNFDENLQLTTGTGIRGAYSGLTKLLMMAPPQINGVLSPNAEPNMAALLADDNFRNDFLHELIHAVHDESLAHMSKSKKSEINTDLRQYLKRMGEPGAKKNKDLSKILSVIGEATSQSTYKGLQELLAYYYTSPELRSSISVNSPNLVNDIYSFLGDFASDPDTLYELIKTLTTVSITVPNEGYDYKDDGVIKLDDPSSSFDDVTVEDITYEDVTDEDSDEDSDTPESTDPNGVSYQVIDNSKLFIEHEIRKVNKENVNVVSDYVWKTFNDSKYTSGKTDAANKSLRFKVSYGPDTQLSKRNLADALALRQHDIIRFAVSIKEKPEDSKYEVKKYTNTTMWAPIIESYQYKNQWYYRVATDKGPKTVSINDVSHYRKSKGAIDKTVTEKVNQEELKQVWADFAWRAYGSKLTNGQESILSEEDFERIPSNYKFVEVTPEGGDPFEKRILASNNSVYISFNEQHKANATRNRKLKEQGQDTEYVNMNDDIYDDDAHFNALVPGDVVDYKIWDKATEKEITVRSPIYRVYADAIELVKSPAKNITDLKGLNLETYLVPRSRIAGVIINADRHLDDTDSIYGSGDESYNYNSGKDDSAAQPTDKFDWLLRRGFYNTRGLKKINIRNVNSDYTVAPDDKQTWYSLHRFKTPEQRAVYSEWRKNLTDEQYAAMNKDNIKDPEVLNMYYHSLAIERRKALFSNVNVGAYLQLESLYKKQNPDGTWSVDESRINTPKLTKAKVIARNGQYLKVMIFEPEFDSFEKGAKMTGYKIRFKTVNYMNDTPGDTALREFAVRSVYHDNSQYTQYVDFLQGLRRLMSYNNKLMNDAFDTENKNVSVEDLQTFSFANVNERLKGLSYSGRKVDLASARKYEDVYDLYELNSEAGIYETLKPLMRTDVGSLILMKIKNREDKNLPDNMRYSAAIVVGKDPKSGLPKIAYEYVQYEKDEAGINTDRVIKRDFTVRTVSPHEVYGVGYLKAPIDKIPTLPGEPEGADIDLMPDTYTSTTFVEKVNDFINHKKVQKFDTEVDAYKYIEKRKNKKSIEILPLHVYPDKQGGIRNKRTDEDPTKILYAPFRTGKRDDGTTWELPVNGSKYWNHIKGSELETYSTATLLSNIQESDIIDFKSAYTKDGQLTTYYGSMMVDRIRGYVIYGTEYYESTETPGKIEHRPRTIVVGRSGSFGLDGVRTVHIGGTDSKFSVERAQRLKEGIPDTKRIRTIGKSLVNDGLEDKFDNSLAIDIAQGNYDGEVIWENGKPVYQNFRGGDGGTLDSVLNIVEDLLGSNPKDVTKSQSEGLTEFMIGLAKMRGGSKAAAYNELASIKANSKTKTAQEKAEDQNKVADVYAQPTMTDDHMKFSQYLQDSDENFEPEEEPSMVNATTANNINQKYPKASERVSATTQVSKPNVANTVFNTMFSKADPLYYTTDIDTQKRIQKIGDSLSRMYDLPIVYATSEELLRDLGNEIPTANYHQQRALIWNGTIYINLDKSTLGEPIHEITHFVVSGLKISDPKLYNELLEFARIHPELPKIKARYPELSGDLLLEEVLANVVGEHYAAMASNKVTNAETRTWENANPTFWDKLVNAFRSFFGKLFGIDSHRYSDVDNDDFMTMTPNDLLNTFTTNLLDGKYKTAADYGKQRLETVSNGNYLKSDVTKRMSSFYQKLINDGFDKKFAEESWFNIKSSNFAEWHNGELGVSEDAEPLVLYRTDNPILFTEIDTTGKKDAVVIKGDSENEDGVYIISDPKNAKSLYSLMYEKDANYSNDFESYAKEQNIPLIGTSTQIRDSIQKLREQFANRSFTMYNVFNDLFMVKAYDTPSDDVLLLRNELFSKNLIKALC